MKKKFQLFWVLILSTLLSNSQNLPAGQSGTKLSYPVPEYRNEIYLQKKDTAISLLRLEKGISKQEMKVKMMGMGGVDQGYELDGEKSPMRLSGGSNLIFILYTGEPANSATHAADSTMKASGMDPAMIAMMSNPMSSMMDPAQTISLYSMKGEKGKRKALLQSVGLMGTSKKTATKYTLSIKKIMEGYHEMIVDKSLPKGEYTFVMASMNMDQSFLLFAFGID